MAILTPRHFFGMGDNECVTLVAEAEDLDDGRLAGTAISWRTRYFDGAVERQRDLGTGARLEYCNPAAPGGDTLHHVTVEATDTAGTTSPYPDEVVLYVIPGGLI